MTDDLTGLHNLRSFETRLAPLMRASARGARADRAPGSRPRSAEVPQRPIRPPGWRGSRPHGRSHRSRPTCRRRPLRAATAATSSSLRCRTAKKCAPVPSPTACGSPSTASRPFWPACPFLRERCRSASGWPARRRPLCRPRRRRHAGPVSHRVKTRARALNEWQDDAAGEALFRAADAALYVAKSGGRNRVAVANVDLPSRRLGMATGSRPPSGTSRRVWATARCPPSRLRAGLRRDMPSACNRERRMGPPGFEPGTGRL